MLAGQVEIGGRVGGQGAAAAKPGEEAPDKFPGNDVARTAIFDYPSAVKLLGQCPSLPSSNAMAAAATANRADNFCGYLAFSAKPGRAPATATGRLCRVLSTFPGKGHLAVLPTPSVVDGNGNISEYLTAAGNLAAQFENRRRLVGGLDRSPATCPVGVRLRGAEPNQCDPFGNTLAGSSGNTASFDYRFSTKPMDFATGLYYYGYRWYDPLTGRWPSRDPIEEEGGINLYEFCYNYSFFWFDFLGGEPQGHHIVMQSLSDFFNSEVSAFFRNDPENRLSDPNYNWHSNHEKLGGISHSDYNKAVRAELEAWVKIKGMNPKAMSRDDARAFLNHIDHLPSSHIISKFNSGVILAIDEARRLGRKLITPGTKTIKVSGFRQVGRRIPIIGIAFGVMAWSGSYEAAKADDFGSAGCAVIATLSVVSPVGYDDLTSIENAVVPERPLPAGWDDGWDDLSRQHQMQLNHAKRMAAERAAKDNPAKLPVN